jgi:hypothetical protein
MSETPTLALQNKIQNASKQFEALEIRNQETYVTAAEGLKSLAALRKEIDSTFDPIIQKAYQTHKEALAQKKRFTEPLEKVETLIRRRIGTWQAEQERIRRQQEEEERRRRLAEAEAEQRRIAEERALAEAAKAEADGDKETAELYLKPEVIETFKPPLMVEPVILPEAAPKVEGISGRQVWKFRIINQALIPREYLIPDEKKIGQIVRAMKGETRIPGVEAYCEETVAVRTS